MWGYTPRRITAFLKLASKRRALEVAEVLSINTLAARGDPKEVKRQHKELTR